MKEVEKKEAPGVSGGVSLPDDGTYPPLPGPDYPYPTPYPRTPLPMPGDTNTLDDQVTRRIAGGQDFGSCIPRPDIVDGPTVWEPIQNRSNAD